MPRDHGNPSVTIFFGSVNFHRKPIFNIDIFNKHVVKNRTSVYTLITFYLALILQAALKVTWIRKAMSEIIKKIVIENRKGNGQNA